MDNLVKKGLITILLAAAATVALSQDVKNTKQKDNLETIASTYSSPVPDYSLKHDLSIYGFGNPIRTKLSNGYMDTYSGPKDRTIIVMGKEESGDLKIINDEMIRDYTKRHSHYMSSRLSGENVHYKEKILKSERITVDNHPAVLSYIDMSAIRGNSEVKGSSILAVIQTKKDIYTIMLFYNRANTLAEPLLLSTFNDILKGFQTEQKHF